MGWEDGRRQSGRHRRARGTGPLAATLPTVLAGVLALTALTSGGWTTDGARPTRDALSTRLAAATAPAAAPAATAAAAPADASAGASSAAGSPADLQPEPDLGALQAQLDAARQQVADATVAAMEAAGRVVQGQIVRAAAQVDVDQARRRLRGQVRRTLTDGPLTSMPAWAFGSDPTSVGLLGEIRKRSVLRDEDEVALLRDALARLDAATGTLDAQRTAATEKAATAVLAADHARRLLDDGLRISRANAVVRAQLAERKRVLDALNAALVAALAKVQTQPAEPTAAAPGPLPDAVDTLPDGTRPDASSAAQAVILQILEATPPGALPQGYEPSGQVFQGESSWYGPGFIGSPTSSGVPYDPEKLTCAMLAVPLGSVVRVTTTAGRSITLLVNDHGPYVGNRIMDVSMRANRILGLGLGQVRIEVLRKVAGNS